MSKFCPLPWNHLFVRANKKVFPCCNTNIVYSEFDETIEKTANAEVFNKFRREFLDNPNKLPKACWQCEVIEKTNKKSLREISTSKFPKLNLEAAQRMTKIDGSVRNFKLERLDIRSSNLCNYKCRFCGIISSNSWLKDHKALGHEVEDAYDAKTGISEFNLPWEDLKTHLPYAKQIKLAGGEPVMMAGTYQLLEELIAIGNTDVTINLITNASVITYGKKNIIDLLKKFKKVVIMLSVDAIGLQHEWLRSGKQDWPKVKGIIDEYTTICKQNNMSLLFHTGVTWMNMWHLEKFIKEYPSHKFIFNTVTDPKIYSLTNYDRKQVKKAKKHYHNLYRITKDSRYHEIEKILIVTCQENINEVFDKQEFIRTTTILDKSRNQSFVKAFPEHARIING